MSTNKTKIIYIILGILIFIHTFIFKFYIIPSESMTNTMKVGDYFIGKKAEYGIKLPSLFGLIDMEDKYIIKYNKPKKKDILIFKQPINNETYIKRVFATGGDEVLLHNNGYIYINTKDINEIEEKEVVIINNKIWIKDPYINEIEGIHYNENNISTFKKLKEIYINKNKSVFKSKELLTKNFKNYLNYDKERDIFTYKLKENEYFMVGDNRDNSIDSRYWGIINMKDIEAKASFVIFNINDTPPNK